MHLKRRSLTFLHGLITLLWKVSGMAPGFLVGAAVGAFFAKENTDWAFLLDAKFAQVRLWFFVSLGLWVVLWLTRRWWGAWSAWGEVDSSLLIRLLGTAARFAADTIGMTKVQREARRNELAGKIAGYLTNAYPAISDVRAIVYEMTKGGTELTPLRSEGHRSHSGPFVKGDGGRGDMAISFVTSNSGPKLVPDTNAADPGWQGSGNGYRCYISAPIVSRGGHHGMLTIDTPARSAFTKEDLKVVTLAANILSIAFSSVRLK